MAASRQTHPRRNDRELGNFADSLLWRYANLPADQIAAVHREIKLILDVMSTENFLRPFLVLGSRSYQNLLHFLLDCSAVENYRDMGDHDNNPLEVVTQRIVNAATEGVEGAQEAADQALFFAARNAMSERITPYLTTENVNALCPENPYQSYDANLIAPFVGRNFLQQLVIHNDFIVFMSDFINQLFECAAVKPQAFQDALCSSFQVTIYPGQPLTVAQKLLTYPISNQEILNLCSEFPLFRECLGLPAPMAQATLAVAAPASATNASIEEMEQQEVGEAATQLSDVVTLPSPRKRGPDDDPEGQPPKKEARDGR